MKKVFLSLTLIAATFSFAQKKEISAAVKAVDGGDISTAKAQVAAADAILGGKLHLLEPSLLEQYYYAKGLSLFKDGKVSEGGEFLGKIGELGKTTFYTGKDGKTKVYFAGKQAADASGLTGLKEEKYAPTFVGKLQQTLNPAIQSASKVAMDAYNNKNYTVSGPKFNEVYNLLKAAGTDDKMYKYYSGITYALGKDYPNAIEAYKYLIDSGYTGVETKYLAKNKKTGQQETMDKTSWDLVKKMGAAGDYEDFKTEVTKSIEEEMYETLVGLYIDSEKYDDAIIYADKAIAKFPKNSKFADSKGMAYYKSGKIDEFVANLKEVVSKNPNDKDSWYNLGVMVSKDPAKTEEGVGYLKKAVEIDPKFSNAWQNLTFLTMGDDEKAIDSYNAKRKAGQIDEANKIIEARRKRFVDAIPYAEGWHAADPSNIDPVSLLKTFYNSARNTAKSNEFKAKEDALKAQGK